MTPLITTNTPESVRGIGSLTDETHDSLLLVLADEIASLPVGGDFLAASLRALNTVRRWALAAGWDATSTEYLEAAAADLYAEVYRDARAGGTHA